MIRIGIVDDHEIFLRGLKGLLEDNSMFSVSHIFSNGTSLISQLPIIEIDILLLDLQLPDISPENLLREIRRMQPALKVIYLTLIRGNRYFNKLAEIGFEGYLLKDSPLDSLSHAIQVVYNGNTYFGDRYSQNESINTVTFPENRAISVLSSREIEVLKLVAQEFSTSQIAEKLFVSISTVDSHRKNIMVKLGVDNIVGLIKIAVKNNLI